jgi:type 1 glutamine amidotransferase
MGMHPHHFLVTLLATAAVAHAAEKKIVFLAGGPSHGPGEHEHRAGCLLLQDCLRSVPDIQTIVYTNGWPAREDEAFDSASAVVVYSDGGPGHPLQGRRLDVIASLMEKGVGFAALHYACQPGYERGHAEFIEWMGGSYEEHWSVNPVWLAQFETLPQHPITFGVNPFSLREEWYFHMRFREGMEGVVPILSAVPPLSTTKRYDGPHSGNPTVRAAVERGDIQHTMWAATRDNGGRGFGFTGGHFHKSWGDENMRRVVLNAILWIAHAEIPEGGVQSAVTEAELQANLDPKPRR